MWVTFFLKNYKLFGAVAILALVVGYIAILKAESSHYKTKLVTAEAQVLTLTASVQAQNQAVDRLKQYADQKDREIAESRHLAEKMQDDADLHAAQIMQKETKIEGTIATLADCQGQLKRMKSYMLDAEKEFRDAK